MKDINQMLIAEVISVSGGILAGYILADVTGLLERIPGILLLIPAFLEMRGNIAGSLAARLGTGLHIGVIKGRWKMKNIWNNVLASFLLGLFVSAFIGVLAFFISFFSSMSADPRIIIISILAAIISNVIEISSTTYMTMWLFKKGYNPDDIMGPVVTTTGDIISALSLVIAGLVVMCV